MRIRMNKVQLLAVAVIGAIGLLDEPKTAQARDSGCSTCAVNCSDAESACWNSGCLFPQPTCEQTTCLIIPGGPWSATINCRGF